MNSCKKLCIVPDCTEKPEFYVNFSRYHIICSSHLHLISNRDSNYECKNCKNIIKCIANLPVRNKTEYKENLKKNRFPDTLDDFFYSTADTNASFIENDPIRSSSHNPIPGSSCNPILTQNEIFPEVNPYNKCIDENCFSYETRKVCETHYFCQTHIQSSSYGDYCKLCPCSKCSSYGVTIKDCGIKVCNSCLYNLTCCYLCCTPGNTRNENCQHYLCQNHNQPWLMCPCSPCEVCNNNRAKSRNCNHRVCDQCEINSYCRLCMTGLCVSCNNTKPLYLFRCNVHRFCEECYNSKAECELCFPTCIRCQKYQSSASTSCKSHPLCQICLQEFDPLFCVYCNNFNDFTCSHCKYTNYYMTKNLNCDHKICHHCSKLSCNHQECPTCSTIRGFCVVCKPQNFCKKCRQFDSVNKISCGHGLCRNCGVAEKDEDYVCSLCGNSQFLNNGNCLACRTSLCDFCKKYDVVGRKTCGHKICKTCQLDLSENKGLIGNLKTYDPKAQSAVNICIFCEGTDSKFQCNICFKYFRTLKGLSCGHKACNSCFKPEKNCEQCDLCEVCLDLSSILPFTCKHKVCERCTTSHKSKKCIICTNSVIFCESCAKYTEIFTCDKNHAICLKCSQTYQKKTGSNCHFCNPLCFYCREKKPLLSPECSHLICQDCYNKFIKESSSCILCDPDSKNICQSCLTVNLSSDIFFTKCNSYLCKKCTIKHDCLKCKPDKKPESFKDLAEVPKNHDQKSDLTNYSECINCSQKLNKNSPVLCKHGVCQLCINKDACKKCLCFKCQKSYILKNGNDGHAYCSVCIYENNIQTLI